MNDVLKNRRQHDEKHNIGEAGKDVQAVRPPALARTTARSCQQPRGPQPVGRGELLLRAAPAGDVARRARGAHIWQVHSGVITSLLTSSPPAAGAGEPGFGEPGSEEGGKTPPFRLCLVSPLP